MNDKPSFYARYSLAIMACCIFLLPFAMIGSANAKKGNKNDVRAWVPKEYEETLQKAQAFFSALQQR